MKQPPIAIPGHSVKDLEQNFFLPWTGSSGATHVLGFDRAVYEEIYPNVDMHFYSGSSGQKMAIVMRAGANPDDVRLQFTGQVSLRIDPWGQLRVYYNGRHFILREAVAYQVDQNNNIIPVNWTASYSLVSGGAAVRFGFSSYDPALPLVFQIGAPPAPGLGEAEPNLCWASYLGGTDYDEIESTTSDASGNHFFTGSFLSDFLTIPNNPGTEIIDGGQVVVVGKFNEQYHLDWLNYFGCSYQQNGLCIATGVQNGEQQVFIGGFVTYNDMVIEPLTGAYNLGAFHQPPSLWRSLPDST